jgi:hypothetical protein
MSDDAKRVILARRRKFVAAAIASVGISCGPQTPPPSPQPCLSQPPAPEVDAGGPRIPGTPAKQEP